VEGIVPDEGRQEALALRGRCRALELPRQHRGVTEHRRDVGVARRQFLRDDAAGERVGARAARALRQRERAQPQPRRRLELRRQQRPVERLEPRRSERGRPDLALDEIAHRVADLELLGREAQVEHATPP
jgi:hypothetical protein